MTVEERFKEYLNSKGISNNRAEGDCGFSNGQIKSGLKGSSFGSDKLEKILSVYTDLSAEWLLRGTGSMIIGRGKAVELENVISSVSKNSEHREQAYDILLGMFEVMKKTYEFYKK